MGVQNDLEKAKKDLESVKKFVEGIELISAKTALDNINKNIAGIVKAHEEKKKKADEGIKKLKEALKNVMAVINKTPFEGSKANDLITKATAAAVAAEQAVKPVP